MQVDVRVIEDEDTMKVKVVVGEVEYIEVRALNIPSRHSDMVRDFLDSEISTDFLYEYEGTMATEVEDKISSDMNKNFWMPLEGFLLNRFCFLCNNIKMYSDSDGEWFCPFCSEDV